MVDKKNALPGRSVPIDPGAQHAVFGTTLTPPYPSGHQQILVGMGCFWGAERKFWEAEGVKITAVGYSAGYTPNPTYEEVCSGLTGHNEVVLAIYDPKQTNYRDLLNLFFESHNPTQGMQQGNDKGTQYRSGIYYYNSEQQKHALEAKADAQRLLTEMGKGEITTEVLPAADFYFAESYHQQYLAKNPNGYCGLGGIGLNMRDA